MDEGSIQKKIPDFHVENDSCSPNDTKELVSIVYLKLLRQSDRGINDKRLIIWEYNLQ